MHLKIGPLHPVFMFLSLPTNKIQLQWMAPTYTELFLAFTNCTNHQRRATRLTNTACKYLRCEMQIKSNWKWWKLRLEKWQKIFFILIEKVFLFSSSPTHFVFRNVSMCVDRRWDCSEEYERKIELKVSKTVNIVKYLFIFREDIFSFLIIF